ncbi:MarR family transcriptional regulator [Clostridium botulinum]|uniref:Winged helix DNA-binding protein n=1 Tax=Clostridium botulinum TaxID=1491 RepID=A0A6B4T819_CLOBO|nr:MarR family transcriptional regulator [Clostridium botulinum]MBN1073940.1 MarR family transcriptional regulator [Clostridium botulinum]NFE58581.1 winged helix DNA-binding protein [Clostridium botulinum]NFF89510.1 winged helix DNA-binding protein [Clostridium botulinum]NFG11153.1 winged helix DNA-binding protein [Clostridium botulinum]NFG25013.1 winged helix DNA-binding protein [Clostridium botulinum]
MEDLNWIDMMEKMQNIKYFSRTLICRPTKEYQISAEHLDLLSQLVVRNEKITPMALSKIMRVSKTSISRIIEQLDNQGYLIKTKDEKDKRSYFVTITPLGEEKLKKIYNYYLSPIYELRRRLGEEEFLKFMEYIENANKKMTE